MRAAIKKWKMKGKELYGRYYYPALIIMIIFFFLRFFGGIIYGNVYQEEVRQHELCLISEAHDIVTKFNGNVIWVETVDKTPAMVVIMYFIDKNDDLSIEAVYDYFVSNNWNISSYNKKHQKMRVYNDKFICDFCRDRDNKKWNIVIRCNDIWTKMEWLEYIFL